jgi:hypothetical protein
MSRLLAVPRCAERGTTLIEAMAAMSIVLVGLLGFMGLQLVTSRANVFNKRMSQATALASDLAENTKRWTYIDARLSPAGMEVVTATNHAKVQPGWDLGRAEAPSPAPQFDDADLGTTYQGLPVDTDGDSKPEFTRYWNVYGVDLGGAGSGTPSGKLVQIIVRWKEPGLGYRQVTSMSFKPNPAFIFQ